MAAPLQGDAGEFDPHSGHRSMTIETPQQVWQALQEAGWTFGVYWPCLYDDFGDPYQLLCLTRNGQTVPLQEVMEASEHALPVAEVQAWILKETFKDESPDGFSF